MEDPDKFKDEGKGRNFAEYSGIAFQMLATIGVFAFIGYKIDERRHSEKPLFAALLSLAGVIISLYQVIKALSKK